MKFFLGLALVLGLAWFFFFSGAGYKERLPGRYHLAITKQGVEMNAVMTLKDDGRLNMAVNAHVPRRGAVTFNLAGTWKLTGQILFAEFNKADMADMPMLNELLSGRISTLDDKELVIQSRQGEERWRRVSR